MSGGLLGTLPMTRQDDQAETRMIYVGPAGQADKSENVFGRVFGGLNAIREDTETTAKAMRMVGYLSICMEQFGYTTRVLTYLNTQLIQYADLIDSAHFLRDTNYWSSKEFKKNNDPLIVKVANVVFLGVSFSCLTCLLDDLKFINLSRIADQIGKTFTFLKPICDLTPNEMIRGQLTVGFGLLGVMTLTKSAHNEAQKRQKMIDIAQFATQVALNAIYAYCGATTTLPLAVLGFVAQGLGVVSFVHHYSNKSEVDKKFEEQDISKVEQDTREVRV